MMRIIYLIKSSYKPSFSAFYILLTTLRAEKLVAMNWAISIFFNFLIDIQEVAALF